MYTKKPFMAYDFKSIYCLFPFVVDYLTIL
jgi:hypothetical protein